MNQLSDTLNNFWQTFANRLPEHSIRTVHGKIALLALMEPIDNIFYDMTAEMNLDHATLFFINTTYKNSKEYAKTIIRNRKVIYFLKCMYACISVCPCIHVSTCLIYTASSDG